MLLLRLINVFVRGQLLSFVFGGWRCGGLKKAGSKGGGAGGRWGGQPRLRTPRTLPVPAPPGSPTFLAYVLPNGLSALAS